MLDKRARADTRFPNARVSLILEKAASAHRAGAAVLGRLISSRTKSRAIDVGLVILSAILVARFSGSAKWTTPYTPDSEFYFTLAVFGDEVTDRAPLPSYFWSKLGIIVPMRALFEVFGLSAGWTLYRFLLILLIVGAVYVFAGWAGARQLVSTISALAVGLNSAVLLFVGDTYFAGPAIAALLLSYVLAARIWLRPDSSPWFIGIGIGLVFSWLLMINPYVFALGALTSAAVVAGGIRHKSDWRRVGTVVGTGSLGFFAGLGVFLAIGQVLFPRLNWIETVVTALTGLNHSDYSSADPFTWLWTATSLLVPLGSVVLAIVTIIRAKGSLLSALALVMTTTSLTFSVLWALSHGGPTVEAQFYSVMMWPAALLGYVSFFVTVQQKPSKRWWLSNLGVLVFMFLALTALGHLNLDLPVWLTLVIFVTAVVVAVVLAKRAVPTARVWVSMLTIVTLAAGIGVAQNSEPNSDGYLGRLDYATAFMDRGEDVNAQRKVDVERWVLANTARDDGIFVWVEPESFLTPPAAMQLYGPNSLVNGWTLGEWEVANLMNHRPTVLATYSFDAAAVGRITSELTTKGFPTTTYVCGTFPGYTQGRPLVTVCLSRVSYPLIG